MVLSTTSKTQKITFIVLFLFCLFIQLIPVVRSGLNYNFGLGFWGPNAHDGIWHLSLINHISNPLKIEMPIYSGDLLKNYHPFFDILITYLSKITFINTSFWLFQLFPLITGVLFLYFSFLLGQKITKSFSGGLLLMFLNSLNNSFGWLVSLFRGQGLSGESLFWAMQSPSNQLNPPFILSILLLLILIYLLQSDKPKKLIIFLILIILPIIKVYSALPAFIIFFFYTLKHKKYFPTLIYSVFIATLLFLRYNSSSSSLIRFEPFWFVNSMIESNDRLYLPRIANMRYTLESSGHLGPRLISYYLGAIGIFYIGNFAWRLLSIKTLFKNKSLFFAFIPCALIPLFFIQKGTSWNTIQFLYYALFLGNISLCIFLSKKKILTIIICFILLLPLIGSLPNYLGKTPPTSISKSEIEALNFLKSQSPGTVLTYPYDAYLKKSYLETPIPIYAYETTSYVAAYSKQKVFLEDEMNLENSGYDWKERREDSLNFFSQKDIYFSRGFLVNNQIDYIYIPKVYLSKDFEFNREMYLDKIFENAEIFVYKVKR